MVPVPTVYILYVTHVVDPVSYTHLDVYKRQSTHHPYYTFQATTVTKYWQSVSKLTKANMTPKCVRRKRQASFHKRKFQYYIKCTYKVLNTC